MCQQQWRQEGLEQEHRAAGAGDPEGVMTRHECPRDEGQFLGSKRCAFDGGRSDPGCCLDTGEVLPHEARLGASRPDVMDAEGSAGDDAQRQRRAQDLTAAFALGAIECDGGVHGFNGRRGSGSEWCWP